MIKTSLENVLEKLQVYLPLVRPYFPHGAVLLVFALLGLANGLFHAAKRVDNPHLNDNWTLPSWTRYHVGPEKAKLVEMDIWDGQKSPNVKPKETVQATKAWRFVGTVRTGKNYTAMIQLESEGRVQRIAQGDTLPNGEKVIGVNNGALQIENNGDQQEIKLFQSDKQVEKK